MNRSLIDFYMALVLLPALLLGITAGLFRRTLTSVYATPMLGTVCMQFACKPMLVTGINSLLGMLQVS